jgi:hypothetical protein
MRTKLSLLDMPKASVTGNAVAVRENSGYDAERVSGIYAEDV